jgi:hypothetical protein
MPTIFSRNAIGALATVISGVATTGLRALGSNTCRLGPTITPTAGAPQLIAGYELTAKYGASVAANTLVAQCWFMNDVGNSGNFPTIGTDSNGSATAFPACAPDFVFFWGIAGAGAPTVLQSIPKEVARPPWNHKVLFRNTSGQAIANVNDTDTVLFESVVNDLGT